MENRAERLMDIRQGQRELASGGLLKNAARKGYPLVMGEVRALLDGSSPVESGAAAGELRG